MPFIFPFRWGFIAVVLLLMSHPDIALAQLVKNNSFASCPNMGYLKTSAYLTSSNPADVSTNEPTSGELVDNNGNTYVLNGGDGLRKIAPDGTILWKRSSAAGAGNLKWNQECAPFVLEGGYLYVSAVVPNLSAIPGITGVWASYTGAGTAELKIDTGTGAVVAAYTLVKTTSLSTTWALMNVKNGATYCTFPTTDNSLTVTDGSVFSGIQCIYTVKYNSSGNIVYAGYVASLAAPWTAWVVGATQLANNGSLYIQYRLRRGPFDNLILENHTVRLNPSGIKIYDMVGAFSLDDPANNSVFGFSNYNNGFYAGLHAPSVANAFVGSGNYSKIDSQGAVVYSNPFSGTVSYNKAAGDYTYMSDYAGTIYKMNNLTGTVVWSAQLPIAQNLGNGAVIDVDAAGNVWVLYSAQTAGGTTTNGSAFKGSLDLALAGFNSSGDIIFSSFVGGTSSEPTSNGFLQVGNLVASAGKAYIFSYTNSGNYPVTNSSLPGAASNYVLTVFGFNPDMSATLNTITGPAAAVCQFGAGEMITGNKVDINLSTEVPLLYRAGLAEAQIDGLHYQWQKSSDNISWTNIAGATTQNYLPIIADVNVFYRRLVTPAATCATVLSTSNVVQVQVSASLAPTVTPVVAAGYVTCPGTAVNIGLNISGGASPYSVSWDNASGTLSNMSVVGGLATATATATQHTVYTAKITDVNGCIQYGQAQVMAYSAGPNITTLKCGGDSAWIGNVPAASGVPGVSYAWSPTTSVACAVCPQTKVLNTGTYTLTMTVPVTGGGSCNTTMTNTVNALAAPTANFAGPDVALCSPANANNNIVALLGLVANPGAGYSYTWSPGSYLSTNNTFRVTLNLGSVLPVPNPITYYLTATQGGCTYVDSMKVSVMRADAGIDGCGPRMVGNPDDAAPGITGKTYSWTRIDNGAGAANFQSGANLTQRTTAVTAGTINTRFQITATNPAGGATCVDTVLVTADCGCNNSRIEVLNPIGCPIYSASVPISLRAYIPGYNNTNLVYDWSPKVGLDRYDSSVAVLTDGVNRTYTVNFKDKFTDAVLCTVTKEVNGVGWTFPSFTAKDSVTCPVSGSATKIINIGQPSVAGYSYEWQGYGLSATNISNPSITINAYYTNQKYTVKVTDGGSGCTTYDTASVSVIPVVVNGGPDLLSCGSDVITLAGGVDSLTDYTYAWTPNTVWAGGTDSTWLHARTTVATNIDFVLKATNVPTGCSATDTVHVLATPPAVITITSAGTTVCKGSSIELSAAWYGGAVYTWTSSNPLEILPAPAADLYKIAVSPQSNATYTVSVSYGVGCAAITGSTALTVKDLGYTPVAHTGYCPTTNPATITLGPVSGPTTGTPPYTYSWVPGTLVNSPTAFSTTVKVAPTVTTNYTLTITDATGCAASITETVSVVPNSKPVAGLSRSMCLGTTEVLGDAGNVAVTWNAVAPASTSLLSSTIAGAPVFTPVAAGTYTYYVQYSAGCVNPDTVVLTVRPQPVLNPTGAAMCSGSGSYASIGTNAVAGLTYQWSPVTGLDSPAAARSVVHATASTNYTLTATDVYGCQSTVAVPVVVNGTSAPVAAVPDLTLCLGGAPAQFMTTLNGVAPVAGSAYTAGWAPPLNLMSITDMRPYVVPGNAGNYTYTVTITDQATGCMVQAPALATVTVCAVVVLPVNLLGFTAVAQYKTAVLNWTTSSEATGQYFDIERSSSIKDWHTIGRVSATHSVLENSYRFTDYAPQAQTVYYRLKMVDNDGTYSYSQVKTVKFNTGNLVAGKVSWFPNPTGGVITIQTDVPVAHMLIADLTGRVVYEQQNVTNGTRCSLPANLAQGMYMIVFQVEGEVQVDKLLLEK